MTVIERLAVTLIGVPLIVILGTALVGLATVDNERVQRACWRVVAIGGVMLAIGGSAALLGFVWWTWR